MQSRDDIVTRNELDGVINAISGRKKSDLQPEEVQGSPKLMVLNVSAEIEIKVKRNMKSSQNKSNPTFLSGGLRQPPSSFEDVFRHFVMNLSDFLWLYSHFSVRGRAHQGYRFGARQVTLFSLYFFRITSQGVAALVSVSDGKIKIYN